MKQGKDIKPKDTPSRDADFGSFNGDEFFNNRLSLPDGLKTHLTTEGMDWRFINSIEFRRDGNMHKSHWQPYKIPSDFAGMANAEGYLQRGDLILAARPKGVTSNYRKYLARRNAIQKGVAKQQADELRQTFRDGGLGKQSKVHEGYGDE